MLIEIEKIEVGERLRSRLDPVKLRQLADDMERNGQLQEIVVAIKWDTNSRGNTIVGQATLIAGYRRLEAAKLLGWKQIRCTRQLGGEVDQDSEVDLLRIEYSENELRENFTEMERIAFGIKIKEKIAAEAKKRMIAGKKLDYEYNTETGYKNRNGEESDPTQLVGEDVITTADDIDNQTADPTSKSTEGISRQTQYNGGEVDNFVANQIGMGRNKFRQGEYVLKHGTPEQHAAIDCGKASVSGTYNELKPNPPKPFISVADIPPVTVKGHNHLQPDYDALMAKKEEFVNKFTADHKRKRKNNRIAELEAKVMELETALVAAHAKIAELEEIVNAN